MGEPVRPVVVEMTQDRPIVQVGPVVRVERHAETSAVPEGVNRVESIVGVVLKAKCPLGSSLRVQPSRGIVGKGRGAGLRLKVVLE